MTGASDDRGGIQLVSKPGGVDQFYQGPRALLFIDPGRDSAAVHIALSRSSPMGSLSTSHQESGTGAHTLARASHGGFIAA
jgi:hypothetical protein